jgi:hypothetical protein
MSFVDLSRFLDEQLQNPIVQNDKKLRLWCLVAKGYTDIEIDYRATKRDWLEAQEIANVLGEKQWATRASGELGLVAFLEGNPGRAARLLGGALLSTMATLPLFVVGYVHSHQTPYQTLKPSDFPNCIGLPPCARPRKCQEFG